MSLVLLIGGARSGKSRLAVDLAGQYADRLVMLAGGRVVASGSAEAVLTEAHVARYYGARVRVLHEPGGIVVLPVRHVREPVP